MIAKKAETRPSVYTRPDNTLENQWFFILRSNISQLYRESGLRDPMLLELLDELRLVALMTDWPHLRMAALSALSAPEFRPLLPLLEGLGGLHQCGS